MTDQQDDWNTLGEFFSDKPNLTHIQTVNLLSKYSEKLEEVLNKQFENADLKEIIKFLKGANETLRGHGVVDLIPEMNEPNLAMYVNMGDTYDTTILYGIEEKKLFVCSWGAYYEETDWYKEYSEKLQQQEKEREEAREEQDIPEICKYCSERNMDCDSQYLCEQEQHADKDENGLLIRCKQCGGYIYDGKCVNGC